MEDKDAIKVMSVLVVFICMILILSGCSKPKEHVDTYKVQIGKKCSQDGKIYSYVWLHTVYGKQQVKKEYCK